MNKEEERKEEPSLTYLAGREIEAKLTLYKMEKEEVIEALRFLAHLISDIDGKLEEVRRCMYGDMKLAITHIHLPHCLRLNLVINDEHIKRIKNHVTWYDQLIKEERFGEAETALTDLQKILTELKEKMAESFSLRFENTERKAHTPIVIGAKKRRQ